jgi:ATP-dependent Clp protease protease subunit
MGTAADMRDMARTMDKIAASMTRGYAAKSGRPEAEIAVLLAAETWFDAQDALDAGLATRLSEPVRIAASFDIGLFRNAPPELVEAMEAESAAPGAEIAADKTDVAGRDDPPLVPEQEIKVSAGKLDPLTTVDDAATPQRDVADDNVPSDDAPVSTVAAANTAPDAGAIRAEAIAHARAVIDLCRLASQPQMVGRFLEEDASLDQVRTKLLAARAEAEPQITSHHPQPGPSPTTRPWGDVIARTFKLKG